MPLRKLVDHLEYRTQVWRFAIRVLREVHNQRFPGGRNFGRDLDLVVAYGFAFISFSKHGRVRLSTLSQQLGMPLETARRKLHQLVELGLLRRDGRDFRLGPVAMKMSGDMKRIMEDQLRRAVRIAHIGQVQVLHPMMDSPALLWVCQPDGSGMIHNPAWCDNYGMNLMEAAEGWKHTAHHDDVPKLLEPWRKSLVTGETYDVEVRRRDRTGEYNWYRTRAVPVIKDGRIIKWCGENMRNSFSKWGNLSSSY